MFSKKASVAVTKLSKGSIAQKSLITPAKVEWHKGAVQLSAATTATDLTAYNDISDRFSAV